MIHDLRLGRCPTPFSLVRLSTQKTGVYPIFQQVLTRRFSHPNPLSGPEVKDKTTNVQGTGNRPGARETPSPRMKHFITKHPETLLSLFHPKEGEP